jgi:hypothetical protein
MDNIYVYVLVREDLSNPQRVVQAGHVLWEISKNHSLHGHPSLVVCRAKDEHTLRSECEELKSLGLSVFEFREPDFGNQLTAIGIVARTSADRKRFRRFKLLS